MGKPFCTPFRLQIAPFIFSNSNRLFHNFHSFPASCCLPYDERARRCFEIDSATLKSKSATLFHLNFRCRQRRFLLLVNQRAFAPRRFQFSSAPETEHHLQITLTLRERPPPPRAPQQLRPTATAQQPTSKYSRSGARQISTLDQKRRRSGERQVDRRVMGQHERERAPIE